MQQMQQSLGQAQEEIKTLKDQVPKRGMDIAAVDQIIEGNKASDGDLVPGLIAAIGEFTNVAADLSKAVENCFRVSVEIKKDLSEVQRYLLEKSYHFVIPGAGRAKLRDTINSVSIPELGQ